MKLTTTRALASAINNEINKDAKFKGYKISRIEMNENAFCLYVDSNIFNHEIDYNINNGKFNVFRISYPLDFYACDRYLTTKDLNEIFNNSDKTFDGFVACLKNYIEI